MNSHLHGTGNRAQESNQGPIKKVALNGLGIEHWARKKDCVTRSGVQNMDLKKIVQMQTYV